VLKKGQILQIWLQKSQTGNPVSNHPDHGSSCVVVDFWLAVRIGESLAEMSGLWNFSVRVQSWSDQIESNSVLIRKIFENHQSDPVLIRPCKIMNFYFASWGKSTTEAILPSAKYDWLKAKYCRSAFASWSKIDIAFWHFQSLTRHCLFCLMKQKHCWSYFAIRRIRLFGLVKWQGRYGIHLD